MKLVAAIGALAAIYFAAGKLGLTLAFVHPSATAVWAPTGITLCAFLTFGYRVWPGILLGAFLVNLTTAGSVTTSIAIAAGNTLEGLAGAYLVNRFANGALAFNRASDIFRFALAGTASTMIAATAGATALALGGYAAWTNYGAIWLTWWLGDTVGDVLVAPVLMLWIANPRVTCNRNRLLEASCLMIGLLFVSQVVFSKYFFLGARNYPLEYLCVPFLVWAGFRFGQREAASATVFLSGIALWSTLHGLGPFARTSPNESLLLLQAFMGITSIMTLALASVIDERRGAEREARRLSVSDPQTGLANYRMLIDTMTAEIARSGRTARPFAVLLLDVDELKKINDRYGHLVGTRALCRLAGILQTACRSTDTPARYGGDEFAIVLPEAGTKAAHQVAVRIARLLAQDGEHPPVRVSFGAAVHPENGTTIEDLISTADYALYAMKRNREVWREA